MMHCAKPCYCLRGLASHSELHFIPKTQLQMSHLVYCDHLVLMINCDNLIAEEVSNSVIEGNSCGICGKKYSCRGNLSRHLTYECGVEPKFQCSLCPFRTKHRTNLKIHLGTKH